MYSFKKQQRLLHKSDYDHVFNKAQKIANSCFVVLYRDNEVDQARLGLAISKKMVAKSHDRNRLKRLLRETFRVQQLPAIDIVILARTGVASMEHSIIINKMSNVWNQLSGK
jgi:ribonuclease P protein component